MPQAANSGFFEYPHGEIGFLSDIRRMNVGMTRAPPKLLIVGDSPTLCRHPFFVELLAYVKGVGGYRIAIRWPNRLESAMETAEKWIAIQSLPFRLFGLA